MSDYVPPYLCIAPNYARPAFSPVDPKPARGTRVLDRERDQANALKLEREQKAIAKKRDGRCRWPEEHKCRFELEAAHILDASLGGLMNAANLVMLCGWIHRRGPESIHGKQLRIDVETARGAWGPLSFWKQDAAGVYYMVAREKAAGVVEKD